MDDWEDTPSENKFRPPKGKILGAGRGFAPAKPQSFGDRNGGDNGGSGGGFRKSRRDRNEDGDEGGGFNRGWKDDNDDDYDRNDKRKSNGHRGSDGEGRGRKNDQDQNEENAGAEKPKRVTYIPPPLTDNEDELHKLTINSGINFDKYDEIEVKVTGDNISEPLSSFTTCGLRDSLQQKLRKSNYIKPTPIQKHAIPNILAGRDIVGIAQTGSGKTAAFLLPMVHKLLAEEAPCSSLDNKVSPQVLIVAPTRELVIQIYTEAFKFTCGTIIQSKRTYGGTEVRTECSKLREGGCNILAATPGRLIDFLNRGIISLSRIQFVVLDEADKMLEMGFDQDVEKVMNHETMVPLGSRQTLMFSATFPEEIQKLATKYLHNYIFIAIGIVGGACSDVEQVILEVCQTDKKKKLLDMLLNSGEDRVMIFVATKRLTDFLASVLSEKGLMATSIHGDREQQQREEALRDFKTGRMKVLVATSVASRGLDIPNVRHVINYDLPKEIEEYVHRIGRTGRLGNKGLATSFYDPENDGGIASSLVKILKDAKQPVPTFLECFDSGTSGGDNNTSFGGIDYRKPSFNQEAAPLEEDWG